MFWKLRIQQASSALLLALCAFQSITPDTQDLVSNTVFTVILQISDADFAIDADQSPDDVCGPTWARRSALDLQNLSAPRLNQSALPTITLDGQNAQLLSHQRATHLGIHTDRLQKLCRLNC